MESKRKSQQEGDERGVQILDHNSKRRREDSQQPDALRIIGVYGSLCYLTVDDVVSCVTGLVKRLVSEELKRQLSSRTTNNEIGTSGSKSWKLVFKKDLPNKIFTFSKINCVEVALYDTRSQSIVTDGPLSSIKVEICVLKGDFGCEDWTTDEFNAKILPQRDNKGRLLKGETNITLENGVGYIPDLEITDNSRWTRGGFRLGVKVLQSNLNHAINIKEGRSNSFTVLDGRGKSNQKDCAPSINDEICCLKHIPKNKKTHQRLRSQGISTVKDLLQELEVETNPSSLKKKFGNISKKYRDEIIEHAKKAKDVDTCVAEATFDGRNYHSEKNIVNSDKGEAYKNLKDQEPIETIIQELVKSLTQTTQHGIPNQDRQQPDFLIALPEEISRQMEPPNWSAEGQFVPGPSHNIDDGNIWGPVDLSQIDQICTPPIDPLFFDSFSYGDGAEPSHHSSFPPDPKGKRKMV